MSFRAERDHSLANDSAKSRNLQFKFRTSAAKATVLACPAARVKACPERSRRVPFPFLLLSMTHPLKPQTVGSVASEPPQQVMRHHQHQQHKPTDENKKSAGQFRRVDFLLVHGARIHCSKNTSRNDFHEVSSQIVHTQTVPKRSTKQTAKPQPESAQTNAQLKGWQQIASFLGQPVSVAQRWAHEGMPVKREGRFITTSPAELNRWLGRESGEPVHVATQETDLSAELKRGLAHIRQESSSKKRRGK